jgi:glutaminyl-peptide cyclotransferase
MPRASRCRLIPLLISIASIGVFISLMNAAPVRGYKVVCKYPHSTENYTEGFFYLGGLFYEGIGLNERSGIVVTVPETGKVLQFVRLPGQYFGEGVIDWGSDLLQWTWQSHVGFVYDRFSLRFVKQFTYTGEGWGMARTSAAIITSDGTATLRFRNPKTFKQIREIVVQDDHQDVGQLNELEYIKGAIYANIWHSDRIARISPRDGRVIDWIDLAGLLPSKQRLNEESVLNGIAYDSEHDRLFVTGKQWPFIFEIKVVP